MIQYKLIFDITQTSFSHWNTLTFPVVAWAVTLGLYIFQVRADKTAFIKKLGLMTGFLVLFSSFGTFIFVTAYRDYLNLKAALQQSQCQLIEGTVEKFHVDHWKSSSNDVFFVNGVEFVYNGAGGLNNGFHQSGILHDGMRVRIYYLGSHPNIARLEIAE